MTPQRYNQLMDDPDAELLEVEQALGWHFSIEWDGLLIGPGMPECQA